jgi:hypothetical protein
MLENNIIAITTGITAVRIDTSNTPSSRIASDYIIKQGCQRRGGTINLAQG